MLVEAVEGDDSGKNIRVKSKKNVLVRLFPCSVPAVKNDEPVETITGELRIKNSFERTLYLSVIPDKLSGDRATGDKYDTGSRPWPVGKLFPDQTLAVGITDTTGSQSRLHVSQIGMGDKAISIAAACSVFAPEPLRRKRSSRLQAVPPGKYTCRRGRHDKP